MNIRLSVIAMLLLAALASFAAAKPESAGPDPDVILRNLYKEHDAQKGPFSDRKNHKLLGQYFTKELADLIARDASASNDEVGAIEFDPLYASQDPQAKDFKIGQVQWGNIQKRGDDSRNKDVTGVAVTFNEYGKGRKLRFEFEQQLDKTWRISEIHYPDGSSLLQLLRQAYPHR